MVNSFVRGSESRSRRAWFVFMPALAAVVLVLSIGACKKSREATFDGLQAREAWVRPATDSGSVTAAYVRLTNGSDQSITISGFASEDADAVELHETVTTDDNMSSMEKQDSVVLGAFENLVMQPGGTHIMLIGTKRPLAVGDKVRITMQTSAGGIFAINAPVREQ